MSISVTFTPSLPATLEPRNWQESLLYRAIDPSYSRLTQTIHLVALIILGVLFSIATLGIGALCFPHLIEVYNNYQKRLDECITTFESGLKAWASASSEGNRLLAKERMLKCFWNQTNTLDLAGLDLTDLPPQIGQLSHLQVLSINTNKLSSLPIEIGNLVNLGWLRAERNRITSLPIEIGNLNLKELDVSSNRLTSLPVQIGNFIHLQTLSINENQLTSLPAEIGNLVQLRTLHAAHNRLSSLPAEIGNLVNLDSLWVYDNRLSSLPVEIGNLVKLKSLSAGTNEILSLPRGIENLVNLESLDVSSNQLASLPVQIRNFVHLDTLIINGNQLISLPSELENLVNLKRFHVSGNRLTALPEEIGQLANLEVFDASNNQISSLPSQITNLVKLQLLRISDNQLNSLPAEIGKLMNLQSIEVKNNQLTTFPESLFDLRSTTHVNAENNHFSADYVAYLNEYRLAHICPQITCTIFNPLPIQQLSCRVSRNWDVAELLIWVGNPTQISSNNSFQTLPKAIQRWQDLLPEQQWPDFKVLEGHRYSGQLIKFLNRLVETKDYQDASELGQKHYAERVMSILSLMVESKEFREIAFCDIDGGVNTCGDALDLVLNDLEILSYVYAGNRDRTMLELAVIAIGLMRLGMIKTFALHYPSVDPVEVELLLQVRLREQLKLPINTKSMLYPGVPRIPAEEIEKFAAEAKERTASKESIIGVLLLQSFWKRRLWEENEAYNAISIEMGKRTDLDQDGIRGITNEKLEALYLADTETWYDAHAKELAIAINPS